MFVSRVHFQFKYRIVCQNTSEYSKDFKKKIITISTFLTNLVIFIAFLEVEEILIFLHISKMADELFLTSFSRFRQRHYLHRIQPFSTTFLPLRESYHSLIIKFFLFDLTIYCNLCNHSIN